jgi:hypothetical protein
MFRKLLGVGIGFSGLSLIGYYFYNRNREYKEQQRKNLWVETDLEPDDVLAIIILEYRGYNIKSFVCGEGDVDNKMNRLYKYNNGGKVKYIKGYCSDKDFPEPYKERPEGLIVIDNDEYMNELKDYINTGNNKMVIMKPPRELYNNFLNDKEGTKRVMGNMDCYLYGSFNLRCLNFKKDDIIEFLGSFKNLYIFETHNAMGTDNTVNTNNFFRWQKLMEIDNFKEICKQWNNYIIKDCIDTCNKIINSDNQVLCSYDELSEDVKLKMSDYDKEKYKRNYKCYEAVRVYNEYQFVMADVGLALCMDNKNYFKDMVKLDFNDNKYTIFTKVEKSNIYAVLNESHGNECKNLLLEDLSDLFKN